MAQFEGLQDLLPRLVLGSQPVGHGRHHGCPLATAILRPHEADLAVGQQLPHRLMEAPGKATEEEEEKDSSEPPWATSTSGMANEEDLGSKRRCPGASTLQPDPLLVPTGLSLMF